MDETTQMKPTFEEKIKTFIESLETSEAEQFLALLETAGNKVEVAQAEPPKKVETADMSPKPVEYKRSYIIESLPGNKMRIIEDYAT
jgi:hypothetical protein